MVNTGGDDELSIGRERRNVDRAAVMQNEVLERSLKDCSQCVLSLVRRRPLRGLYCCPECYTKIAACPDDLLGYSSELARFSRGLS
jgi:hypothetical protein